MLSPSEWACCLDAFLGTAGNTGIVDWLRSMRVAIGWQLSPATTPRLLNSKLKLSSSRNHRRTVPEHCTAGH